MLYNYSFSNRTRDLTDVFLTVVKDEPRFISNFISVGKVNGSKCEWFEDHLCPKAVNVKEIVDGTFCFANDEVKHIAVGTTLVYAGDTALWEVTDVKGGCACFRLAAKNGSELTEETLPKNGGLFYIVSNPEKCTEEKHITNHNNVQSFWKDIILTGRGFLESLWGTIDNQINRQTAVVLADLARDLNRVAIFGRNVLGENGGLYHYATGYGALEIDAKKETISLGIIGCAGQLIIAEGGEPNQILCSPKQASLLAKVHYDRFQILRSDDRRGACVAVLVNELSGRGFTIIADPDIPDTECWVVDSSCFGMAYGEVKDKDNTPDGFDGIRRTVTAELSLEFKNAKQRCCRIKNLQHSSIAQKGNK